MSTVLLALTQHCAATFALYPRMFKRAGVSLTIVAPPSLKRFIGSGYTSWIAGSDIPAQLVEEVAALCAADGNVFDQVIWGDNTLLRALAASSIDPPLRLSISPITKDGFRQMLGSHCQTAAYLSNIKIRIPKFGVCNSAADIQGAVNALTLPVTIKPDHGDGVTLCKTQAEVDTFIAGAADSRYLVQKAIEGNVIHIDAQYAKGEWVAGCASMGDDTSRRAIAHAPYTTIFTTLGNTLGLNGFVHMQGVEERKTGYFYLTHLDFVPSKWPSYVEELNLNNPGVVQAITPSAIAVMLYGLRMVWRGMTRKKA